MRERIGPREAVLALAICGLLAGLVAAIIWKSSRFDPYLYDVNPALLAAAGQGASATASGSSPHAQLLPERLPGGLQRTQDLEFFTAEDLYKKIDGQAEEYIAYDVRSLTFGTYTSQGLGEENIQVYLYDMHHPVNAFGIWQKSRSHAADPVDVGNGGYRAAGSLFFWDGSIFVELVTVGQTPAHQAAVGQIARAIDQAHPNQGFDPWADELLPKQNRTAQGLQYLRTDAFGLSFMKDTFAADYLAEDATYTCYVRRLATRNDALQALDQFADSLRQRGKILEDRTSNGLRCVRGDSYGMQEFAFTVGPFVAGVTGGDDRDVTDRLGHAFRRHLIAKAKMLH